MSKRQGWTGLEFNTKDNGSTRFLAGARNVNGYRLVVKLNEKGHRLKKIVLIATLMTATFAGVSAAKVAEQNGNRVSFTCDNGERLEMRFFPAQGVAVLVRDGRTTELQQQVMGSGFRYEGGGIEVLGKGTELTVEADGKSPLHCQAE